MTTRREALLTLGALALIPACGSSPPAGSPDTGPDGCRATSISDNHDHALVVPMADVTAGTPRTYSIAGTAGHSHDVTLTAADFTVLAAGSVIVTSTVAEGHQHTVTIRC